MRVILILILAISIFGCSTDRGHGNAGPTLADKAVSEFVSRMDDPDSFELVRVTLVDSASVGKNIRTFRDAQGDPSVFKGSSLYAPKAEVIRRLDSVENSLRERGCLDSIVSYSYYVEYRAANLFGAKVLSSSIVQISPSGQVWKIASDANKLALYPGGFPGYNDVR